MNDTWAEWLRAIDAVRPDSDDRSDPELAARIAAARERFERECPEFACEAVEEQLAAFDRHVADLLPRIDVPPMLETRLLAALDAQGAAAAVASAEALAATRPRLERPAPAKGQSRRRQWLGLAAIAAALAAVFAAGILSNGDRDALTEDMLHAMAVRWVQELPQAGWKQEGPIGATLEPSRRMAAAPRAFQRVDLRRDGLRRGMAYRYLSTSRDGVEAILFVMPLPSGMVDQLSTNPPDHPPATSHGLVAAWRDPSHGVLYIVVIREAPHHVLTDRYRSLVNTYAPTA